VKLRKEEDMIFFVKFAHWTNTQIYPNEINEQKKIFMSSLALLTITPVLRASCTEIRKNNEDLVNSGNAGEGGSLNVCLLHFGSVAFSWLRGGAVCSVHSTELNWTWHRIAHSATGYSDKKRHNWRTHISLYSFQMHCALRTVYWNYIQVRGEFTRNAERWCTTIYSLQSIRIFRMDLPIDT